MELRRLHPDPATVTTADVTAGLGLGELAPPGRPYLVLNMVATLDGRIAIDGRSGPIGNQADREIFHGLRTQVDAVMVGAGTVRTERYGRMVKNEELRARRTAEELAPDPIAVVMSARFALPADLPLFQDPDSHVVVCTASEAAVPNVPARVDVIRGSTTLASFMHELRERFGVRSVLCEGGPSLNEDLLREGLVDELFLALAPKVAGGDPLTIVIGAALRPPLEWELVSLHESESNLFMRYRRSG